MTVLISQLCAAIRIGMNGDDCRFVPSGPASRSTLLFTLQSSGCSLQPPEECGAGGAFGAACARHARIRLAQVRCVPSAARRFVRWIERLRASLRGLRGAAKRGGLRGGRPSTRRHRRRLAAHFISSSLRLSPTHSPSLCLCAFSRGESSICGESSYPAFSAAMRSRIAFLPSPNIISVLSLAKSGLGMPANPGDKLRLTTITVRA